METIEDKIAAEASKRAKRDLKNIINILGRLLEKNYYPLPLDFYAIEKYIDDGDLDGRQIHIDLKRMFDQFVKKAEDDIIAGIERG